MSARQRIADLVSTVEGVTCTPYYTQTLTSGVACVHWTGRAETDDEHSDAYVDSWTVRINIPKDVENAERRIDALAGPLIEVLQAARYRVTQLEPVEVNLAGATTNALLVHLDEYL